VVLTGVISKPLFDAVSLNPCFAISCESQNTAPLFPVRELEFETCYEFIGGRRLIDERESLMVPFFGALKDTSINETRYTVLNLHEEDVPIEWLSNLVAS
jgi:hypothetical protein